MKNTDEIAISVKSLTKTFKIPLESHNGIKQKIINLLKGRKGYREFTPLNDISFDIKKGEFFGIVGRNGSGKSTLLKSIAGIYSPDKGAVVVNGKLIPFIELGVGFNAELSGRENVFLNGALLGFSHKEMEAMYDEIVDFAELHDFMEERLKNYSSGMQVRLAFSIAIRAEGDILLLDEVLAVGDEAFQRKCYSYFAELKKQKKTVILVTHSMNSVQQFCDRAMLIKDGVISHIGDTNTVSLLYRDENSPKEEIAIHKRDGSIKNDKLEIKAKLTNKPTDKELKFALAIIPNVDIENAVIAISISAETGGIVYRWASNEKLKTDLLINKNKRINISATIQNIFPDGKFSLNVSIRNKDMTKFFVSVDNLTEFEVVNPSSYAADTYWKPNESIEIYHG